MPESRPLRSGDPGLAGDYEIVGRLGEGGLGTVYLGLSPAGGSVAIRIMRADLLGLAIVRTRFLAELEVAKRVVTPYTARVLDTGVTDGDQAYIVSEYVRGPSLQDLIVGEGPRGPQPLERLAVGIATALSAVHKVGIVHRDIRPANVLLGSDGPRVIDFGIAHALEAADVPAVMTAGQDYLSPEQLTGAAIGPPADVFAWGSTVLFAATGRPPFGQGSIHEVTERIVYQDPDLSALPDSLRDIVAGTLAKDLFRRPTAAELVDQLLGKERPKPIDTAAAAEAEAEAASIEVLRKIVEQRQSGPVVLGPAAAPSPPLPSPPSPPSPPAQGASPAGTAYGDQGPGRPGGTGGGGLAGGVGAGGVGAGGRPGPGPGIATGGPSGAVPSRAPTPAPAPPPAPPAPPPPATDPGSTDALVQALLSGSGTPDPGPQTGGPGRPGSGGATGPVPAVPPQPPAPVTPPSSAPVPPYAGRGPSTGPIPAGPASPSAPGPMNGSSYEDYDKHGPDDLDDPYRSPATSRNAPPRESPSGWSGPDFRPDPRPRLDRGFDRDLDRVLDPAFERDFERDFDREPGRGSRRDRAGDFGRERGYGVGAPAGRRSLVNDRTLVVAISVVIGVIIGFLVVAFVVKPLFDSGKKASGRASPNATTSALDNTPVDRIPAGFKGTWRGTAVNQDGRSFRVTAVFKEGQTTASVLYTPMNCVGVLTLVRGTRSRLEMNLTDARPCTDGTVIVTRQVDGTVIYGWHHPGSRHHYRATLEAAG